MMVVTGSSGGAPFGLTAAWNSSFHCTLIPSVTARRPDLGQRGEVEIGDGFQRLGHRCAAQAFRECREPVDTLDLDPQQHIGRVILTLRSAAPVDRPARPDHDGRWLLQVTRAIARLAFGVAQRVLALGFLASWHGPDLRYVTLCSGVWPGR